ncbi:phosphopantetheinyl transferase [Actinokineospora sp. 24-640]
MSRWGSAAVAFRGLSDPAELVAPMALEAVYTRAERVRSGEGRTLQHWAGRLAAKHAVLRLLGVAATPESLAGVEVLPRPSAMCARGAACLHGHPPEVHLRAPLRADDVRTRIRISVSHTADLAVAVALTAATLPEDER